MYKRQCDKCKKFMDRGKPFYKVCLSKMEGQTQRLNHAGDICENCWNLIINSR
jgi:hypothetical protein